MYSLILQTPPAVEPLSLGETKDHLKVDTTITEDDEMIEAMIVAARQLAEGQLQRCLITQTWVLVLPGFTEHHSWLSWASRYPIVLPLSPVQSVMSVLYYDASNVNQSMDPASFEWTQGALRSVLAPVAGQSWPPTYDRLDAVAIRIVVGFGDSGASVPRTIRQWMLAAIGAMYEHRSIVTERGPLPLNPFLDGLLDPYRLVEV